MFERRDLLKFVLLNAARPAPAAMATLLEPLCGKAAAQAAAPPLADPAPFQPGLVSDAARTLAKSPFKAPSADLPESLRNLNYEQYVGIRNRREATLWAADNVGFALEPLHRGFIFAAPMQINIVEQGMTRRLVYDASLFEFGKMSVPPTIGDIGFSGFRILVPQDGGAFAELAIYQGASFFRAVTRGQNLGVMARALTLKTADPKGEEFPFFRSVWIEKPSLAGGALVIHAVIDSESATGAYRFTIRPGEATIIDTECTLFTRSQIENFGLGAMAATHFLGSIDQRRFDDIRPNVSEARGVQILTGRGEWLWRPVANRETLQISTFVDENPRGFGFLQRDRDFDHYQDDDQHWERRPSLWIEPIGDWGPGGLQLLEIPSDSEVNDNIIAYWRPRQPLAAGSEQMFAYRQFWCWNPPERPSLAVATASRSGKGSGGKKRRFIIQFDGDNLADSQRNQGLRPTLACNPGTITQTRWFSSRDGKQMRVAFEIDPGGETYCELRVVLEASGKPMSETWLYRWTA